MSIPASQSPPAAALELPGPRAFGAHADDLSVDFAQLPRPALTTTLLACCEAVEGGDGAARENNAWKLPLGVRIGQLLRIVEETTEEDSIVPRLMCTSPGCQRPFEVALPVNELLRESGTAPNVVPFSTHDGAALHFRRVTGADQAEWSNRPYGSDSDAIATMVATLVVISPSDETPAGAPVKLPAADLAALAAAMEAADPLVAFSIQTICPHCGAASEIAVDLEALALDRLARHRRSLLRTVHQLATHYGWTEREILALPPGRRREYQLLIESES